MTKLKLPSFRIDGQSYKNNKYLSKFMLNVRQFSILLCVLMFLLSSVFTLCAYMGYIHAEETLQILVQDIENEQIKNEDLDRQHKVLSNEEKLKQSESPLEDSVKIFHLILYFGLSNMMVCAFLTIGVLLQKPILLIFFIIFNGLFMLTLLAMELTATLIYASGLNLFLFILMIISSLIAYVFLWTFLLALYKAARNVSQKGGHNLTKNIRAFGGLTHTINPKSSQIKVVT